MTEPPHFTAFSIQIGMLCITNVEERKCQWSGIKTNVTGRIRLL